MAIWRESKMHAMRWRPCCVVVMALARLLAGSNPLHAAGQGVGADGMRTHAMILARAGEREACAARSACPVSALALRGGGEKRMGGREAKTKAPRPPKRSGGGGGV